jgi:hypothetical protein
MPIVRFTQNDIDFANALDDWRHARICRRDAVTAIRELRGWSTAYIETFLDKQWLPPDQA